MQVARGYSVTHFALSSPLGGGSNAVLYGHDDIEGSVFAHLAEMHDGDAVVVETTAGQVWRYSVVGQPTVVAPMATSILAATPQPRLTLFTCYPLWVDNRRVVITADLVQ